MNKKQFVEMKVKELMLEGKTLKESLAISFTQWSYENMIHLDNWIKTEHKGNVIKPEEFINAIGKVKFRQFSNTEDMLKFSNWYYLDFCKTFQKKFDWETFSKELAEYWIMNLYGR